MKKLSFIIGMMLIAGCQVVSPTSEPFEQQTSASNISEAAILSSSENSANEPPLQTFENREAGFSLEYPSTIGIDAGGNETPDKLTLSIAVQKVEDLDAPLGNDRQTAALNMKALKKIEFGPDMDFLLQDSKRIFAIGTIYGKSFMTLGRFEVCSIVFDRSLIFYRNDYQVRLTLHAPATAMVESMPHYFTTDTANCGQEKVWDSQNNAQARFYADLTSGKASPLAEQWFTTFDRIVRSIGLL